MTDTLSRPHGGIEGLTPPQALEAERSVLAALLLGQDAIGRAEELLDPEAFYRTSHRKVYEAIIALYRRNEPADLITLTDELRKRGDLEAVGGPPALAELLEYATTTANLEQHVKLIHSKSLLRSLIRAASEIQQESYAASDETSAILDRAESRIFAITDTRVRAGFVALKDLLKPAFEHIQQLFERKVLVTGVDTGYDDINKMTSGLQNSDLIVIGGRPSVGKCVAFDTELVLDDGSVVTIGELYRRRDSRVSTLRDDLRLDRAAPARYVDDGVKPVFEVTTRLGRRVETTAIHPFLTLDGWRPLCELKAGDFVAVPRTMPVFGSEPMRECEIKLVAYLIGDGCLTGTSPMFTTTNPAIEQDFRSAVEAFGACSITEYRSPDRAPSFAIVANPVETKARRAEFASRLVAEMEQTDRTARSIAYSSKVPPSSITQWRQGKVAPSPAAFDRLCAVLEVEPDALAPEGLAAASRSAPNAVTRWLVELGLWKKGAAEKMIPECVFRLDRPSLALFLRHLFATDGWATVLAEGQTQIGYCSVSERLARQVVHLLLRFGVITQLRRRMVRYRDTHRVAWQVDLTHGLSIRSFLDEIGIFGKENAIQRVREALRGAGTKVNCDLIPIEIWNALERIKGTMSWSELARRAAVSGSNIHAHRRSLSRGRLARFAAALGDSRLEHVATSDVYWDRIESIVPTGAKQVYDLTIPGTHNFVANDVCVHNTSFAMNIAENAAIRGRTPVAIFSLEMSKEQLVQRLLCSQAEVPLHKLRNGYLSNEDWPRLTTAAGLLTQAPIMIDDSSSLTVMEVRAKCRRLKSEGRLGLVMIDYLQLLRGGGQAENRVQEISQITRSLKALAKELNVPVIALSQLSRAVETRDKSGRPQLSDLRESGCMTADTRILRADTNEEVTMGELLETGEKLVPVWTMDDDFRMRTGVMTHVFASGVKDVFEMRLASGKTVKASANHPFYTIDGWKALEELKPGDRLATPRRILEPPALKYWPEAEIIMLAHMLGDGCFASRQPVHYTSADLECVEAVEAAARHFGISPRRVRQENWWHVYLPSPHRLTHGKRNPIQSWLERFGLDGRRSYQKFVPAEVAALPKDQVALFLKHLWATDGSLHLGKNDIPQIYYSSTSRRLVENLQMLLLRFGIVGRIRQTQKADYRPSYQLNIYGSNHQRRFLDQIGVHGARSRWIEIIRDRIGEVGQNPNVDTIPRPVWNAVKAEMQSHRVTARALAAGLGTAYCGSTLYKHAPSRERLGRVAALLDSPELGCLAGSDVFWDEIAEITPLGPQPVFDATVLGTHNFVANGIFAHNSVEQDADVVMFVYREVIYNRDTPEPGKAQIIIAKQRNGPTGDVDLTFLRECTKFVPYSPMMMPASPESSF